MWFWRLRGHPGEARRWPEGALVNPDRSVSEVAPRSSQRARLRGVHGLVSGGFGVSAVLV